MHWRESLISSGQILPAHIKFISYGVDTWDHQSCLGRPISNNQREKQHSQLFKRTNWIRFLNYPNFLFKQPCQYPELTTISLPFTLPGDRRTAHVSALTSAGALHTTRGSPDGSRVRPHICRSPHRGFEPFTVNSVAPDEV